jgi:putative transposase
MTEIYHVLSRGVDKRKIFFDEQDSLRFIHDLFEFNDEKPVNNNFYKYNDVRRRYVEREPRKLLVKIHAFCLMPNHYHLLLVPNIENGVMSFMKKINGGYAKYFNIKYKRRGTLFEGRYKKILIKDEAHFIHLPYYIHLNPLDIAAPEWRDKRIKNYNKAIKFLESYRWSSHLDYLGKKNFPSVTQRNFLLDFFGGHKRYERSIKSYLKTLDLEDIKDICLE